MELLYLRHGRTAFSAKNLFMGHQDLPLLPNYEGDFINALDVLKNFKPEVVYHSPLKRATQTLEAIKDGISVAKSISCPLLIERDFGNYEGKEKSLKSRIELESDPSVEPAQSVKNRANQFFDMVRQDRMKKLVIGHSGFYQQLCKLAINSPPERIEIATAVMLEFR